MRKKVTVVGAGNVGATTANRVGTEREGLEDVTATADPTVDHHGDPSSHRRDYFGQGIDRRPKTVHCPSAMVGNVDPVGPVLER